MRIQVNREGFIVIHDGNGVPIYHGTKDCYDIEIGVPLPAIPEGRVSMEYRPGDKVLAFFDRFGNSFPVEGDTLLPELKAAIENPEVSKHDPLRLDHQEALVMNSVIDRNAAQVQAAAAVEVPVSTIGAFPSGVDF